MFRRAVDGQVRYASLPDLRSMNGHAQSGGHWNAAFRVMARGSRSA